MQINTLTICALVMGDGVPCLGALEIVSLLLLLIIIIINKYTVHV